MRTPSKRRTRSKHRPLAAPTLDQRIAALIAKHDQTVATVIRAVDASKKALEITDRELEEARKLKKEIQAEYNRLKELRDISLRGIV